MTEHPDLLGYHLLHRGMRTDMARLRTTVTELTEAQGPARARRVSAWYSGFLGEFRHHHTVEDEIFFPALAERIEVFGAQLPRLDEEHRGLDIALVALDTTIRNLADPNRAWSTAHQDAREAVTAADTELNAHLDYEDSDVLPLFVECMSVVDFEELEQRAAKSLPRAQIKFSVPWLLSQTTGEERRQLLAGAPMFLRLMWYLTRSRYRRLAQRAFAG